MNTTFLWPTLAILVVAVVWQTAYNIQRFARGDKKRSEKTLLGKAAGCLFQWIMIIGVAFLGYRLAGIMGTVGALLSMFVLPMAMTFIYLAAAGRLRRRGY